jgi:uncharacterized membrane protein YecN with MAPEG domain
MDMTHSLGSALVLARISHYLGITELGPFALRPLGMFSTVIVVAVSSIGILLSYFS